MAINDSGPWFPPGAAFVEVVKGEDTDAMRIAAGASKLEVYAKAAMQGLLAADGMSGIKEIARPLEGTRGPSWHDPEAVADAAFDLAVAMLAEHERRVKESAPMTSAEQIEEATEGRR